MGIALRELQHCNNCNSEMQSDEKFLVKYSRTAMGMLYLCIVNLREKAYH